MGRPKSDLLSGLGTWFEIAKAVTAEILAQGGSDDDVRAILKNHELRQKIAALIIAACPNAENNSGSGIVPSSKATLYPVVVPADRTLEQMIAVGRYDWKNEDVVSKFFPDVGPAGEYELVLVHFNREASTKEALAELKRLGLEPAYIGMLLAFGEKYPEIQREFPVVALNSVCIHSNGLRYSPYLYQGGHERVLNLRWIGSGWHEDCRFLAFRRKSK